MWIFGYGSLMWKVDFPYEEKTIGHIKGYERKFYQHSTDHRGTPEKPGRVVTLIPSNENTTVYGIAYKIKKCDIEKVVAHLDFRERGGFERKIVTFHPREKNLDPFEITIYVASEENPQYAGPADLDAIAYQIFKSVGPSGPNIDYLCNLAKTMRDLVPEECDEHLFKLEEKVLELIDKERNKDMDSGVVQDR